MRKDGGVACKPRWHVHLRDDGNACSQRGCVRGQLRVRRVHGRVRWPLPAALGAAVASTFSAPSYATDVLVQRHAFGQWQQHIYPDHLYRPELADAAAATSTPIAAATPAPPATACATRWLPSTASIGAAASGPASSISLDATSAATAVPPTIGSAAALGAPTATITTAVAAATRAARRLLASAAASSTVVATVASCANCAAASTWGATVLPHRFGKGHGLRRRRRVCDSYNGQRGRSARQVQRLGRRSGRQPRFLRVRQDGAVASKPGWHLRNHHGRDTHCRRECVRGQLRVRRVHD